MNRVRIVKSSGFKTAVLFLSIFIVAAGIAGTAAFFVIRDELVGRHKGAIENEFTFFAELYRTGGANDMTESLQAHARSARGLQSVYALQGADGAQLAGNVALSGPPPHTGEVSAATLGVTDDFDYYIKTGPVGNMTLMVGNSAEDLSEIEEVFVKGAMWAGLVLVAISLAGGFALSVRMNGRIAEIRDALQHIADGHFDVRLPKSGNDDDVDILTSLVDGTVDRLGKAVEINRQISADIAHDLKSPMNRLRISVEKALTLNTAGQPVKEELEAIEQESTAILKTFDALLRIAQIESGARKARFGPVDVASIFATVAEFYAAHAEDSGAALTIDIRDELPGIAGDAELLAQAFANLIENALKHAGEKPQIECIASTGDGTVVVSVCDDGPGIPADERNKVLRRLYRLDKSRTTEGSGLGLSMVKAIADLHGATLELDYNRPGLAVRLAFPVAQGDTC